jgi:uncharacterized protein YyaL (SSP411 family)
MANRLINETSPYLLQHAHNPVDWFPWGGEALQKAKNENKPILVSIGYSACHWCHVMEKESFEDEGTANIMNEFFVNIKIDREERPDLDHIYMDAVQAMTGSGGWPLNVFLTPDAKPFYGGTYFPPQKAFNRPSWKEILFAVSNAFKEKRSDINSQAQNLTEYLSKSNSFGSHQSSQQEIFSESFLKEKISEALQNIIKIADKEWGGFGKAPKFPQTFIIKFLLRHYYVTKNEEALNQACLSLDKMIEGGIYDQVGGGFARYSTDNEWLVPHFEKMLYDNALIISVLCEAYQLTKKQRYKEVIDETLEFIQREMMNADGGFYSAIDADSEGGEGKFYVWKYEEVTRLLGSDAKLFCEYFDITPSGNWEGKNILRTKKSAEIFAAQKNISINDLNEIIKKGKSILLAERNQRTKPLQDDKIILGWNAFMNIACSKAFAATGNDLYRQPAIANMNFLLKNFEEKSDHFFHTWKNNLAKQPAFLDDYAFLIQALLNLQEITGDTKWVIRAKQITKQVIKNFSDEKSELFFFTPQNQEDVILRKKEIYDGATPSGNSVMLYNLYHLSILFDVPDWKKRVESVLFSLIDTISQYPSSFGIWNCLLQEITYGTLEIALVGKDFFGMHRQILSGYTPHKIYMVSPDPDENFPLLAGKTAVLKPLIYVCRNYACQKPLSSVDELMESLHHQEQ